MTVSLGGGGGRWEGTYQKNHPSSVVGEDNQADGDEAKSHRLVCPGGLEKKEGSAGEMTRRASARMEGPRRRLTLQASHSLHSCARGRQKWLSGLGSPGSPVHQRPGERSGFGKPEPPDSKGVSRPDP